MNNLNLMRNSNNINKFQNYNNMNSIGNINYINVNNIPNFPSHIFEQQQKPQLLNSGQIQNYGLNLNDELKLT